MVYMKEVKIINAKVFPEYLEIHLRYLNDIQFMFVPYLDFGVDLMNRKGAYHEFKNLAHYFLGEWTIYYLIMNAYWMIYKPDWHKHGSLLFVEQFPVDIDRIIYDKNPHIHIEEEDPFKYLLNKPKPLLDDE